MILGEDIEEFKPENIQAGFLVNPNKRLDFQIIRGLRHLAKSEGASYVSFQNHHRVNSYGVYVDYLKSYLVLARFFNRRQDSGINSFISEPHASISNNT